MLGLWGTVIFIHGEIANVSSAALHEVIPGRVASFMAGSHAGQGRQPIRLNVVNVHNFGIRSSEWSSVRSQLIPLIEKSQTNYDEYVTFLAGDWNFLPPGESRLALNHLAGTTGGQGVAATLAPRWRDLLSNTTDFDADPDVP